MKVFALLLFAGVSLAAFRGEEGLKVPADLHLKGYQPLNTYKYQYEACLTSGFPDTEQQYAGLKIVCDTEFYFGGDESAFLKIKNPQLFEVNGTSESCSSESLKISPVTEELAPLLEKPIKFQYRDGKVKSIYCSNDEPEYVLNIKRGILSLINHNFTRPEEDDVEPRMYKNWEYGSYGLCENLFDVQHLTLPETSNIGEMRISKILNLESCKEKPYVMANGNTGIGCLNNSCNIIDKPLKISITTACDMLGKESNFMVRMCETVSNYVYAPTQMKGSAATMVKQTIKYVDVEFGSQQYPIVGEVPHKLRMTNDDDDNKPLTNTQKTEYVTRIIDLIKLLIKNVNQKEWKAYKFTTLVEMLQKVDRGTLDDIWVKCLKDEQLRQWLLEALRYVYNEDAFDFIADRIKSQALNTKQAVSVLLGFAFNTNPSEKICLNISELCLHSIVQGDETLKKTCYLTQGALMHEYCRKRGPDCLERQALELTNRLLIADCQEKINLVKMIGNFGHRSLYRPLLDIIEDTANMLELRVTAVYALRRIAPRIPQKVLPVLLKIFRQVDNDVELRMACFVVICDSKPGPAVFNLILAHLQRERTNQVRSFVVSYIKGMAFSKYPCDEKMAKTARFALRMLRKHRMDLLKSKWFHWGQFSELLQLGGSVDLQMISTPSSFLPRSITSKVKVQMLGRSMNLFEAGVRGEGVQELLQRVVGPRPQSTGKKTLLSKLMLKSSSLFDKEVREINKMLPTAQYEEEKTKGSFYFKMMGKELFYNSFTDEDIKGFIDDGFLSMQGEFTELLRKGKVFNLTKVFLPMERMFVQPSVVGIPLKFTLQSVLFLHVNSTIKADMKETFFIPRQLSINGKLNISVLHSTWGKMKIYLPQLETGSKMKLEINITSGLGGSVNYNVKEGIYTTELDLPQEEQQIFSADKHGCTFLMYTKPVKEMMDRRSLYNSTRLDGLEIGEVAPIETFNDVVETFLFPTLMGPTDRHAHSANWTLRTQKGKYLSVNEHNELTLCEKPTVFRVIFIDNNRQFVKLFVPGKGYVKVKPNSKGCLEINEDEHFPKLFKITHIRGPRFIRLETVVFIHPNKSLNPTEWTQTTAAMNTDQVLRFKNLIEDMREDTEVREKWRYLTDLPLDDVQDHDRFHPRHMKLVFITPVEGKVCLRPNRSDETVFTVRRQRTQVNELCYGEQLLGMDVCLSGEYIKPFVPHPPVFPFSGPAKFNVSIKPGKTPARKIQFKFEKGDQFDDKYKTWKASMNLLGTNPEKKIESQITYDVNNKKTNISFDLLNMLPWLRRVCITSHVISDANATFNLEFGKSCGEYKMETLVNVVEPGRRQVDITTSYKLPYTVNRLFYKLFRAFSSQVRDRLSAYKILRGERSQVQFVVKFKTEQLVDLEFIMPSRTLTMDDVRIETNGFIPHGNPIMNLMPSSSSVCTVDYNTYSTFDGVEFQYSSPRGCPHILAKDCANNSFMVLLSKEDDKTDDKIVEIFVDSHKIRVEYLKEGHYQIQVNGDVIEKRGQTIQVNSITTIVQIPEREELHVLCENGLQVIIVRGIKIDIRVSPFLFNRTCGMCGDLNAEQYQDLKTPRGLPYTCSNKQKYGHLWLVPDPHFRCSQGNCQLKKEYLKIPKTIDGEKFDCFTTTPVLRCLEDCQATESQITGFHLTCAKTNSKEVFKISDEIAKRTVDLTERDVHFKENLVEHFACDCSACSQRNI